MSLNLLSEILDTIGFSICHQLPERTLYLGGRYLPVCARDTGIYIGFLAVLFGLLFFKRLRGRSLPKPPLIYLILALAFPMVLDAVGSYLGLFQTTNINRVLTGLLFGGAVPLILFPIIDEAITKREDQPPVIRNPFEFVPLLAGILLLFIGIIITKGEVGYWILAVLSIVGLLVLYYLLFLLIIVLVIKHAFVTKRNRRITIMGVAMLEMAFFIGMNYLHSLALPLYPV